MTWQSIMSRESKRQGQRQDRTAGQQDSRRDRMWYQERVRDRDRDRTGQKDNTYNT
jgi:hypothetical protein